MWLINISLQDDSPRFPGHNVFWNEVEIPFPCVQNRLNIFNLDSNENLDLVESFLKDPREVLEDLDDLVGRDHSIMFP